MPSIAHKRYQASVHAHLAAGETNRSDGTWTTDHKNRETSSPALLAAHRTRNARSIGHVRPMRYQEKQ